MATIKDVARLAGVGVGTASRVISGKGSFSKDAAERVAEAVKQLGFRPSAIARALSLRSTGTIGVFVPDFKGPYYGPLLHAIDTELRQYDRHMVVANGCGHDDRRQQALDGVRFLISRDCDGIIVSSTALKDSDFQQLRDSFTHLAAVNRDVKGMRSECFTVDHRVAGRLAATTLLDHGHRYFAVVSGPASASDNRQRLQGFFDALEAAGVDPKKVPVEEGDFAAQSGWEAIERLQHAGHRFTALFSANDQMAMGAISCLRHRGVAVPHEVSVVGYDDTDVAAFLSPRLTSVHIPIDEMGLNACRMLLNDCYGLGLPVSREFEPRMVLRDSIVRRTEP
ncbi:LacI family DNA-binding transcriptional regulator [Ideonella sp. DXS29W]|uniref:LacI family DNA-binding transcriptional regulator n=1 Tax=Ideonella lacteola TaxID=2984193 RepID=A0ABU9BVK1_9BURK